MKKSLLALPILVGIIVLISIPSVTAQSETVEIPSWVKGVAGFWIDGGINDEEFAEALEFLINGKVIIIKNNDNNGNDSDLQKEYDILKEKYDEQKQVNRETVSRVTEQYENSNSNNNQENTNLKQYYREEMKRLNDEFDQHLITLRDRDDLKKAQAAENKQRQDQQLEDALEESEEFETTINELEGTIQNLERENEDLIRQIEGLQ